MGELADLGTASQGLWTRSEALLVVSRGTVDSLVADGEWQRPLPGVFADGGYDLDAEQWALAGVLASGGAGQPVPFGEPREDGSRRVRMRAAACGRDAARVWGFPLVDDDDPATGASERFLHDVHVWGRGLSTLSSDPPPVAPDCTPHPDQPRAHELRRHRLVLAPGDYVRLESGLVLTSQLCTALHCVQLLSHEAAVCVLDDGLHRELFTHEQLVQAVSARAGKPGGRKLAAAAAVADGRAESPAETLARLILVPSLPGLVPQVKVRDRSGRVVARLDLGDEEVKLAVDVDGKRGHAGDRMVAKDQRRDRRTGGLGWVTERAVWFDVRRRQQELLDRVVARDASLRRAG